MFRNDITRDNNWDCSRKKAQKAQSKPARPSRAFCAFSRPFSLTAAVELGQLEEHGVEAAVVFRFGERGFLVAEFGDRKLELVALGPHLGRKILLLGAV